MKPIEYTLVTDEPAPKDGELYLILVKSDLDNYHPTEDESYFPSMGFNLADCPNTEQQDIWRCVGWNWCSDEFINIEVKSEDVVAWAPIPKKPSQFIKGS